MAQLEILTPTGFKEMHKEGLCDCLYMCTVNLYSLQVFLHVFSVVSPELTGRRPGPGGPAGTATSCSSSEPK